MDSPLSKTARNLARGGPRTLILLCVFGGILLLSIAAYSVPPEVGNSVLGYASNLHASLTGGSADGTVVAPSWQTGPVVFVLVMFGANSAYEGQHMVKSIIMQSSRTVQIHILCTPDAMEFLQRQLELVTRPAYDASIFFYPLTKDAIVARAHRAGIDSIHHAGVGGLAKMFIHEVRCIQLSSTRKTNIGCRSSPKRFTALSTSTQTPCLRPTLPYFGVISTKCPPMLL